MASFDIVFLFTCISVDETYEVITRKVFDGVDTFEGLSKKLFMRVFDICYNYNLFLFNEKMYKQTDGAPMGDCVSPKLDEVFMGHYETIWLEKCPLEFKPVLYKRCVDDSFALFKSESHIEFFLIYLNSQHSITKFTHETEHNGCFSFLDVHVKKQKLGSRLACTTNTLSLYSLLITTVQ